MIWAQPERQNKLSNPEPGWYDDGSGAQRWWDGTKWTEQFQPAQSMTSGGISGMVQHIQTDAAAGGQPRPGPQGGQYVVLQVVLKEKLWGSGSGNLTELEQVLNTQASYGYRLHTITTESTASQGMGGGFFEATMVFEKIS